MHTVFSEEHSDYTSVKVEGPLKSGHYRYLLFSFLDHGLAQLDLLRIGSYPRPTRTMSTSDRNSSTRKWWTFHPPALGVALAFFGRKRRYCRRQFVYLRVRLRILRQGRCAGCKADIWIWNELAEKVVRAILAHTLEESYRSNRGDDPRTDQL